MMQKVLFLILWTLCLFALDGLTYEDRQVLFLEQYERNIVNDLETTQQGIYDDSLTYETKVFYEINHEAQALLDKAQFAKNPYSLVKKAFDIHTKMQNGMFAVLSMSEKKVYMQEHRIYLDALFKATIQPFEVKETFNRWINYKRTLFDRENLLFSNHEMRAKKNIINRKKRELATAYQERPINRSVIASLKIDIEHFEKSLSSDLSKTFVASTISFYELSTVLKPNELYMDFAKIGDFYYLFTLNKDNKIGFEKLDAFSIDNLLQKIQKRREKIINLENFPNIKEAKEEYGNLYQLIMKNISLKDKTSVIISPDGLLNLLPFEALYFQKYLVERLDIRYVPSAKELLKLHKNSSVSNDKIILFANPNFNSKRIKNKDVRGDIFKNLTPTFSRLKGTLREANKIKSLFPFATLFSGNMASESNLLKTTSPKILHLATHGFFLENDAILNPMLKSGIVLSGANNSIENLTGEGIITALELSELNLKGTALVVLSACNTGVGKIEEGEGVAGLNKAFISAGTKQIIMSLWSVSDSSTALLMEKFYENIKQGDSYNMALNSAKKWMIKHDKSHPYYWAGFVSSGLDN